MPQDFDATDLIDNDFLFTTIRAMATDWRHYVATDGEVKTRTTFRRCIEIARKRGYHTVDAYPDALPLYERGESEVPNPSPVGSFLP